MDIVKNSKQANELMNEATKEGFKPILTNNVPLTQGVHTVTATGVSIARKISAKDGNKYLLFESQFQTDKGEKFYAAISDTSLIDELQSGMKVTIDVAEKTLANGKKFMQATYKAVAQVAVGG